jgi:uncharacterized membrane protein
MSNCKKCGKPMSKNAKYCKACGSNRPKTDAASLDQKKARVMEQDRSWKKWAAISAVVAVVCVAAWLMISTNRAGSSSNGQQAFAAQGGPSNRQSNYIAVTADAGSVRIPLPAMNDSEAHFYVYSTSGGKTIKFFVLRAADGRIRAAFDACQVCYNAKLGYHQEGDFMVCNNCGRRFRSVDVEVITGGCNPIPVKKVVETRTVLLKAGDLDAGSKYF